MTNRPLQSGTTPLGYEPDPNYGTRAEFVAMCQRLRAKNIPLLIWMSHSGLAYRGGPEIDDDWFIRGIDGRICAAWGNLDNAELAHINPGHPGYIEYTKKWMRFYIQECGCKGIFFDCLGWAFPPDYVPRPWMRFPGDTNVMAVRFAEEIGAYLKELDPQALFLGEGTSIEFPTHVFSLHANPKRAVDGLGPRDWFLGLNAHSPHFIPIDQGPALFPASGFARIVERPEFAARNRLLTQIVREREGNFAALPGDLSVGGDLLFVPAYEDGRTLDFALPAPWDGVLSLVSQTDDARFERGESGFEGVTAGIYRMES